MEKPVRPDQPGRPRLDPQCRLIETFGYWPRQGIVRRDLHLARLLHSAQALGFRTDRRTIEAEMARIGGDQPLRCRLTLGQAGDLDLTTAPLPGLSPPWTVAIAAQPLDSRDPFLRHKTTRRRLYDAARSTMPEGVDELLFLNERQEVCEGTITNLFVRRTTGEMITPPLSSGLLPGVLRQSLLDAGQVVERVVRLGDLQRAHSLAVGNSLRGLIPAEYRGPDGPFA